MNAKTFSDGKDFEEITECHVRDLVAQVLFSFCLLQV